MKMQKNGLSALISILATLTIGEFRFIPNSQFKIINFQALAQTQAERKTEAGCYSKGFSSIRLVNFKPLCSFGNRH
jgi:hypothetical protein